VNAGNNRAAAYVVSLIKPAKAILEQSAR